MSFETPQAIASELSQFTVNERDLYRQRMQIIKGLAAKKARGDYKPDLAVKAFAPLIEAGAKAYAKEFGGTWKMFDVSTRRAAAKDLVESFEAEYDLRNYDYLLPKKYQKTSHHARKAKSIDDYEAEGYNAHTWYLADSPYSQPKIRDAWQRGAWKWQQEQRARRPVKASHATHKLSPAQLDREITRVVPSWRGGR